MAARALNMIALACCYDTIIYQRKGTLLGAELLAFTLSPSQLRLRATQT